MTVVSAADWPLEGLRIIGLFGAYATENSYEAAVDAYPTTGAPPVSRPTGRSPGRPDPPGEAPKSVRVAARQFVELSAAALSGRRGPTALRSMMSDVAYQDFCQIRDLLAQDADRPVSGRLSSVRMRTPERLEIVGVLRGARRDRALAAAQELRGASWWCTRFLLV